MGKRVSPCAPSPPLLLGQPASDAAARVRSLSPRRAAFSSARRQVLSHSVDLVRHKQRDKQVSVVGGPSSALTACPATLSLFSPLGKWTDLGCWEKGMRQRWCGAAWVCVRA